MTRTSTRTTRIPTPTTPTRTPSTRANALTRAIEPLPAGEFLASYWERRPFVAARNEPRRFDDLLSEAEVERLVCETAIRYPAFRLVKAGAKLDVSDYTTDVPWRPSPFTGTIDVDRVLAEWEAGATIVLQALHLRRPAIAAFSRDLERALGHPVQVNAYYTPRSAQGLPVHHDTHDVFSLQVAGEKRWLVYEPVWPLPLKTQRYSPALGEPGEPVLDVTLRPGDTLYLPRGWLHEAMTSATDSLHLTVGVNVHTWLDAVRAALDECGADLEFRRAASGDGADALLERLRERLRPEEVERRRRERRVRTRSRIRPGQLRSLRALDRLTIETPVERRGTIPFDLRADGESVALAFEGKTVVFPAHVRLEVSALAAADGPVQACDLPGELDEAGRLVLVRRLVREGFLRVSDERRDEPSPRSGGGAPAAQPST
jgi:bifunctional lysine-specific demethylase and histidyl-hydroxylase NO66